MLREIWIKKTTTRKRSIRFFKQAWHLGLIRATVFKRTNDVRTLAANIHASVSVDSAAQQAEESNLGARPKLIGDATRTDF